MRREFKIFVTDPYPTFQCAA